jgi:hypothetical protein
MNRRQRKLVYRWIGLACVFIGCVVLERILKNSPGLFSGILFLAMIVALLYEGPTTTSAEERSEVINQIVNANPWIKVWLFVCALCGAILAVIAIFYDMELDKRLGFGGLLAVILLIGAPILIAGERERFLSYGTYDDA